MLVDEAVGGAVGVLVGIRPALVGRCGNEQHAAVGKRCVEVGEHLLVGLDVLHDVDRKDKVESGRAHERGEILAVERHTVGLADAGEESVAVGNLLLLDVNAQHLVGRVHGRKPVGVLAETAAGVKDAGPAAVRGRPEPQFAGYVPRAQQQHVEHPVECHTERRRGVEHPAQRAFDRIVLHRAGLL